ncbi:methylmalonyl-CoA mutase small subunit [Tessaracoccus oleiagri]|uniref:Methylmalonyl-CoA mutase small subunit n=1 Tax=Tessaracoccus oleiagri TaxID=686624 RepID=A0A1G9H6L0_9ACTN|nr:methylmalonyl-CoA mutase small subunit [Tessaracoccus oleiagri]SDL08499.1 methylmalonyl-CoA mutase [Tessaracoccus oleiagri]
MSAETQGFNLAADFATPTQEDWEREVLKVLNRGRPEGKQLGVEQAYQRLTSTTVDGLTIKPLYTREDGAAELGHPGVAPFTRGATVRTGEMEGAWQIAQLHEDGDVATTKAAILADLERGGTAVYLRVDPDAIAVGDLATALEGVMVDLAPVYLTSRTQQLEAARALVDVLAKGDAAAIRGNLGVDPIGAAALAGTDADLSVLAEAVELARPFPGLRPIVVDATIFHNAGAGDVHELAYAVAVGVEYVRALVGAGLGVDEAFDQILFRVSATTEQFLTISRLRALRTLWNRVGEVVGVSEEHRGALQHAVTSLRQLSRDDAYVNILRTTISTFAVSAGGAEVQTVLPFDTVVGLPSDFSRRIARNVQILLGEESNIGRVNDPAGGSFYVESMTAQLAEKAWEVFQSLDAAGFASALADGTIAAQLEELNRVRAQLLATRKLPLTGVSMFPNPTEKRIPAKARPEAPALGGLQVVRDAQVFEDLRDRSDEARAAGNPPKVLLACLGQRRDFGAREGFTSNLFQVAGIETVVAEGEHASDFARQLAETGATVAVLCSNSAWYEKQGLAVARALKEVGARQVLLAGQIKELGVEDTQGAIDGNVFDGMNVVELLRSTLDLMGASK